MMVIKWVAFSGARGRASWDHGSVGELNVREDRPLRCKSDTNIRLL